VVFQLLLPIADADLYPRADLLRVRQEFIETNARYFNHSRNAVNYCLPVGITERCFVGSIGQIARLLKLNRQEERSGDVNSFQLDASLIECATHDFVIPETQSARIR